MLASISEGTTRIKNLLMGEDSLRAIETFREMGVKIKIKRPQSKKIDSIDLIVHGVGMHGLKKPKASLYLGNSGTTMRILPGILAGQKFSAVLKGDKSLSKRPMQRIVAPLRKMHADISGRSKKEIYPPLKIHGKRLKSIRYKSKQASAQVKSCILMAGLFADGITNVTEPAKSRDHTERMLNLFGADCKVKGLTCKIKGPSKLKSPGVIEIPGDISSAAFFIAAGCILPNTKIIIKDVGLNPTRTGSLDILKRMGADIKLKTKNVKHKTFEPIGDITIKSSRLKGVRISSKEVVRAIDEIPIIMVAACFAKGETFIRGAGELRVKETDRIKSMAVNLRKIGADIRVDKENLTIKGNRILRGGQVSSFGDHRTAMSMIIAGLAIKGKMIVTGSGCINKSFPGFKKLVQTIKLTKT